MEEDDRIPPRFQSAFRVTVKPRPTRGETRKKEAARYHCIVHCWNVDVRKDRIMEQTVWKHTQKEEESDILSRSVSSGSQSVHEDRRRMKKDNGRLASDLIDLNAVVVLQGRDGWTSGETRDHYETTQFDLDATWSDRCNMRGLRIRQCSLSKRRQAAIFIRSTLVLLPIEIITHE